MTDATTLEMQRIAQEMEAQHASFAGQTTPVANDTTLTKTQSHTAEFNSAAFSKVYKDAGMTVEGGVTSKLGNMWAGYSDLGNMDVDATLKTADVNVTLSAIVAGDPSLKEFVDIVRSHDDLKQGFDKILKDEGYEGLKGLQTIMSADGAADPADLKKMMENPAARGMVAQMMHAVGTDKFGMDYAAKFITSGIAAGKSGATAQDRDNFMKVANEAGIDPGAAVKSEVAGATLGFFKDVMRGSDVKTSVKHLMMTFADLGMGQESMAGLENLLTMVAGPMQFLFRPYMEFLDKHGATIANGAGGLLNDVQNAMKGFDDIGAAQAKKLFDAGAPATGDEKPRETANADTGLSRTGEFQTASLGVTIRKPDVAPEWAQPHLAANRTMGMSLTA